ncbi:hypothetical protein CFOL_v3_35175, partial [Cephalotus follicularis]
TNPTS